MLVGTRKYKPSVLQKRPLYPLPVDVNECNLRFGKQKPQLLLGWGDCIAYLNIPKASVRIPVME